MRASTRDAPLNSATLRETGYKEFKPGTDQYRDWGCGTLSWNNIRRLPGWLGVEGGQIDETGLICHNGGTRRTNSGGRYALGCAKRFRFEERWAPCKFW